MQESPREYNRLDIRGKEARVDSFAEGRIKKDEKKLPKNLHGLKNGYNFALANGKQRLLIRRKLR